MRVQIQVPKPKEYPSFTKAFNGRQGTVIAKFDGKYGSGDVISIKLTEKDEVWINVSRDWLRRPEGVLRRPRM